MGKKSQVDISPVRTHGEKKFALLGILRNDDAKRDGGKQKGHQQRKRREEKQDLLKQQKTLQVIEHNFDAMIREAGIKIPEKEPSPKTQEDILS